MTDTRQNTLALGLVAMITLSVVVLGGVGAVATQMGADLQLQSMDAPDRIEPHDTLEVGYIIENVGDAEGTESAVELVIDGSVVDANESVTVGAGETASGVLVFDAVNTEYQDGETINVTVQLSDFGDNESKVIDVDTVLYAGGSGTTEDPYEVTNWNHLGNVSEALDSHFVLGANLDEDTEGYGNIDPDNGFAPIGTAETPFTGTFDGNDRTITDLTIDRETESYVGLFAATDGATVERLGLDDAVVKGDEYVGGLVGYVNDSTVTNTTVTTSTARGSVEGTRYVGGLVGLSENSTIGHVELNDVNVNGIYDVGGVVGLVYGSTVDSVALEGVGVNGTEQVGGAVGVSDNGVVKNLTVSDPVVDGIERVGGSVGVSVVSTVDSVVLEGVDVNGTEQIGGAVGLGQGEALLTLKNISATGHVSGQINIGGLVGELGNELLTNSTADVAVTGDHRVGGAVGGVTNGGEVFGTHASGDVTGENAVGGLAGLVLDGNVLESRASGDVVASNVVQFEPPGGVGGLAGNIYNSDVRRSFATGNVTGEYVETGGVGGLVGTTSSDSTVRYSYATGAVTGEELAAGDINGSVGGLVGIQSGSRMANSYSAGPVTGDDETGNVGALVGYNETGSIDASYWDSEVTGVDEPVGRHVDGDVTTGVVEGLTTREMSGLRAPVHMEGFLYETPIDEYPWMPTEGGYPTLAWASQDADFAGAYDRLVAGSGTAGDPYRVTSVYELQWASLHQDAHFELQNDIDASTTEEWFVPPFEGENEPWGFLTIGTSFEPFTGSFDGNGHTIHDVTIGPETSSLRSDDIGLFGTVEEATITDLVLSEPGVFGGDAVGVLAGQATNSTIENIVLEDVTVEGQNQVGGAVGVTGSSEEPVLRSETLRNISVTGDVTGEHSVGGIVGELDDELLTESTADVQVIGGEESRDIGGAVGSVTGTGTVERSYATGAVEGGSLVGGLVGVNTGQVNASYATGEVLGMGYVGGLVGGNAGEIVSSFAAANVSVVDPAEYTAVGGLAGANEGTLDNTFWDYERSEFLNETQGVGDGSDDGVHNLTSAKMTDDDASDNMEGLDFDTTWGVTLTSYPALQWEFLPFEVAITGTNAPVEEGETLTVDVAVTNPGAGDARTISLIDDGTGADATSVALEPGESETITLTLKTERGGAAEVVVTVANEAGETVTETVEIQTAVGGTGSLVTDSPDDDEEDEEEGPVVETEGESSETGASVESSIEDAQAGERIAIEVPDPTEDQEFELDEVGLIPETDANFDLSIEMGSEPLEDSPDAEFVFDGTTELGYVSADAAVENEEIEEVEFTFRVDEEHLAELESEPEDVSLYRHDEETNTWEEHETEVVGEEDGDILLQTTADGFSEWTAAAKRPDLDISDTEIDVEVATTDEDVTIQVFVTNTGGADGTYETRLLANDEIIDREDVTVPSNRTVIVDFIRTFDQPDIYEVQVNNVTVGEIEVTEDEDVTVGTPTPEDGTDEDVTVGTPTPGDDTDDTEDTPTEDDADTAEGDTPEDSDDNTDNGGALDGFGPGFGILTGIIALVGVVLLRHRRR